jgi:hypothetical protein
MPRGEAVLSFVFASLVAACGGGDNNPDAQLVPTTDAPPPDASRPDAFVCTLTECGGECVDTSSDPDHCGGCDDACQSGAECEASDCVCIANYLPNAITPGGLDQVFTQAGITIRLGVLLGGQINALGIGYNGSTETGVEYALTGELAPPLVLSAYNVDVATMNAEAGFVAVAGTLEFTDICAEGIAGTLTGVTFQAANLDTLSIDPNGCTFAVPTLTFSIGAACPDMAVSPL